MAIRIQNQYVRIHGCEFDYDKRIIRIRIRAYPGRESRQAAPRSGVPKEYEFNPHMLVNYVSGRAEVIFADKDLTKAHEAACVKLKKRYEKEKKPEPSTVQLLQLKDRVANRLRFEARTEAREELEVEFLTVLTMENRAAGSALYGLLKRHPDFVGAEDC